MRVDGLGQHRGHVARQPAVPAQGHHADLDARTAVTLGAVQAALHTQVALVGQVGTLLQIALEDLLAQNACQHISCLGNTDGG
jgi:hypothetical protein